MTPRQTSPLIPASKETTPHDLAYWMGTIDARMCQLVDNLGLFQDFNVNKWSEFDVWRRNVDIRLADGSGNFNDIYRQISELRAAQCSAANCPIKKADSITTATYQKKDDDNVVTYTELFKGWIKPALLSLASAIIGMLVSQWFGK